MTGGTLFKAALNKVFGNLTMTSFFVAGFFLQAALIILGIVAWQQGWIAQIVYYRSRSKMAATLNRGRSQVEKLAMYLSDTSADVLLKTLRSMPHAEAEKVATELFVMAQDLHQQSQSVLALMSSVYAGLTNGSVSEQGLKSFFRNFSQSDQSFDNSSSRQQEKTIETMMVPDWADDAWFVLFDNNSPDNGQEKTGAQLKKMLKNREIDLVNFTVLSRPLFNRWFPPQK